MHQRGIKDEQHVTQTFFKRPALINTQHTVSVNVSYKHLLNSASCGSMTHCNFPHCGTNKGLLLVVVVILIIIMITACQKITFILYYRLCQRIIQFQGKGFYLLFTQLMLSQRRVVGCCPCSTLYTVHIHIYIQSIYINSSNFNW